MIPLVLAAPVALAGPTGEAATVETAPMLKDPARLMGWLVQHNHAVLSAAARLDQAAADLAQSRLLPNPSLTTSLSDVPVGTTNPPGLGFKETSIYGAALSQTLEIGKRGPRIAAARLRLEAERQSYLDTLTRTTAEARYALGRVIYLGARQAVLEENLAAARQNLDLQRTRAESGDLSGNDYDRLLVDTLILESEVSGNRQEHEAALASCGALLVAPCADGGADPGALADSVPIAGTPDVEATLGRRPDLEALALTRDAARQDALLARRRRYPDPNLSLGYTHDNLTISGDQPDTLMLSLGIPLPVFDRGQHEAQRADGRARELDWTARGVHEQGRAEAASLLGRKASLESTLRTLVDQAVPRSKGILEATLTAVNQGGMSMTDLLLARRTHTDLMLKVMDLQFDLFAVRNDLRRALGLDVDAARQVAGAAGALEEVHP
ncbi:MAG TPA: TolC family protein [Candidatus Polarisedimenticolia bacterium]|nr:TolC family protein [Candidatus Polarisedimenticolia bacterium]